MTHFGVTYSALLHILESKGQAPTTKNYLVQNVNGANVSKP